jgi:glycosyltransferase involved in cell wall biosynthesis
MPLVSIIVPCYNEEATICLLLEAIAAQTFPQREMEVILADGMSSDHTRERAAACAAEHPDLALRVVDNPKRIIPAGLNCALNAASGEIIIRLDAHSMPASDYVERTVADLRAGLGDNVGGVWEIRPGREHWIARSIAAAAAHPLGVGDALYRYTTQASAVDTVPFGGFERKLITRIGSFDETLLTNEDYEFNTRIRQNGGRVWLDPAIRSVYFARPTLPALAQQYFRYGFWKWRMLKRYPTTLRWRQAIPPLFVFSLLALVLLSAFWWLARLALAAELGVYLLALLAGAVDMARRKQDARLLVGVPAAIATMHVSWGWGFLWSMLKRA